MVSRRLLWLCLMMRANGNRIRMRALLDRDGGHESRLQAGCSDAKNCGDCLTQAPFMLEGEFCKWCPHQHWSGPTRMIGVEGSCRPGKHAADDCRAWYLPVTASRLSKLKPFKDREEALLFCPAEAGGKKLDNASGEFLAAMEENKLELLHKIFALLNFEVQRLNRFRNTNPVLFGRQFQDHEIAKSAAKYSWQGLLYASPQFSGGLSNGLTAVDMTGKSILSALRIQGRSQHHLISEGRDAFTEYFSDVTYGMLYDTYVHMLNLTSEQTRELVDKEAQSWLTSQKDAFHIWKKINANSRIKQAKQLGHIGLFVGGFFTSGATWLADFIWNGIELAAEIAKTEGIKVALKLKTRILMGLLRLQDESVWDVPFESSTKPIQNCDITAWFRQERPCEDLLNTEGRSMTQVCTRGSPWGHHLEKGLASPQGRCFPTSETLLNDGLPCLTHISCRSSYCHFETKMQYFFSDHDRVYRTRATHKNGSGVPILDQLRSLQVMEELLPGEHAHQSKLSGVAPVIDFIGEYKSFEGVKYSTIGTCARACPKSEIGKGECAGITLQDGPEQKDEAFPKWEFGIQLPNRLVVGNQVYALVGQGDCADKDGILNPVAELELDNVGHAAHVECAESCKERNFSAFNVVSASPKWKCHMHEYFAGSTILGSHGKPLEGNCYGRVWSWPLHAYQPWNPAWYVYMSDVTRVVSMLKKDNLGEVLAKVAAAYINFCPEGSIDCPKPTDWNRDTAISMLTAVAPLSISRMRILRSEVDPSHHDAAFRSDQKVFLQELLADAEWGEAWRRLYGEVNVEKARSEGPSSERYTLQAKYAQKLQQIAVGGNLRMQDGVWDLAAAQEEYIAALDQPFAA